MLSFELAQELKAAGFPQSTSPHAVYSLNDHLRIRREHAVQMWYGNKTKIGVPLELEEEAVYTPNLTELVVACGKPLDLACDKAGHWKAAKSTSTTKLLEGCETAEDALGRLWLLLQHI
jgi:hypothetical protein